MNIERLLYEIKALGDAMLWSDRNCLNLKTSSDVDIVRFVRDATVNCRRIRAHMNRGDDVVACEAVTELTRIVWLPAHRVTKGAQTPVPHPLYEIADDLMRLSGDRTYTFLVNEAVGVALDVIEGSVRVAIFEAGNLLLRGGRLVDEEAYELIGATGYNSGKLRVHVFNPQPPHKFYAASSVDGAGLRWLPEEFAFEEKHLAVEMLRERFNYSEEAVEELLELFTPSYFHFDYPLKGSACPKS